MRKMYRQAMEWLYIVCIVLAAISMVVITIIIPYGVFMRYAANAAATDCLADWLAHSSARNVMVAGGNTPLELYRRVAERGLKLSQLSVFALDEYVGVPLDRRVPVAVGRRHVHPDTRRWRHHAALLHRAPLARAATRGFVHLPRPAAGRGIGQWTGSSSSSRS